MNKINNNSNQQSQKSISRVRIIAKSSLKLSINLFNNKSALPIAIIQYNLAVMYKQGIVGKRNLSRALMWYQKAAHKGHIQAQHILGLMYYNGRGVQQDFSQAIDWFHSAAIQGNLQAQRTLADMYGKGQGVKQDYNKAFYWYQQANN